MPVLEQARLMVVSDNRRFYGSKWFSLYVYFWRVESDDHDSDSESEDEEAISSDIVRNWC